MYLAALVAPIAWGVAQAQRVRDFVSSKCEETTRA